MTSHRTLTKKSARELSAILCPTPQAAHALEKSILGHTAGGGQAPWCKFVAPELKPGVTIAEVIDASLRAQLVHVLRHVPCVRAALHPEGVHQMRVATRRIRATLKLFKAHLPLERRQAFSQEFKWLANGFGPARDWDVFSDVILAAVTALFPDDPDLVKACKVAHRLRTKAAHDAAKTVRSRRFGALMIAFTHWIEAKPWADADSAARDAATYAGDYLESRRMGLVAKSTGYGAMNAVERHRLRIASKKMRYELETLQAVLPEDSAAKVLQALRLVQDELGHLNDLVAAEAFLITLVKAGKASDRGALERASGKVLGWMARGSEGHGSDAANAVGALHELLKIP